MYQAANERSENFMKQSIWWMLNIAIKLMVFPTMVRSYYDYYFNGLSADASFFLAFRIWWVVHCISNFIFEKKNWKFQFWLHFLRFRLFRLPYNWKTPISYFFTMLVQYLTAYYSASCYISAFNVFYGICLFLNVFTADLEQSLRLLEDEIEQAAVDDKPISMQSHYKLKRSFCNFVRWHAAVKE